MASMVDELIQPSANGSASGPKVVDKVPAPEQLLKRWLAGMGIQSVFGWVVGVDRIRPLEVMAREVIPVVAEL